MLSFYPSVAHTHCPTSPYSARSRYSDDVVCLHPSISVYSSLLRTSNPESRYRRALAEYLAAEEELLRARQEAILRAREEALRRQEEARVLQARTIRAREQQQVQQFKRLLAQRCAIALATQTAPPEVHLSHRHGVPAACSVQERRRKPISSDFIPKTHVSFMGGNQLFDSIPVNEEGRPEHRSASESVPENEASVPNIESFLQTRLRKVAIDNEDKEVQDLARATLQHLVQHTPYRNDTSAPSSEETLDSLTPLPRDTDLSRSDALQGATAEAAKASFKAHREAVAEQEVAPSSKDTAAPLEAIQDIRATFSKLSADFSIPASLEFSDDEADGLAYTPTNAPIRVYEHALEGLLAQLDAVESDGDEEVRVARRSVVKEVETALEGVESELKKAREVAKDNNKHDENDLAETTASSSDLVEDTHPEAQAGDKTEEDSASIPSHNLDGAASFAADFVDVAPDNSAIEATSSEESTKVVAEPTSPTSPATVQDEVAHIEPEHEASVSPTSETREEAVSVSHEGYVLTSTPVSPAPPSPTLPDDVSLSRVSALPTSEGDDSGHSDLPDDVNDEDGWSEIEA